MPTPQLKVRSSSGSAMLPAACNQRNISGRSQLAASITALVPAAGDVCQAMDLQLRPQGQQGLDVDPGRRQQGQPQAGVAQRLGQLRTADLQYLADQGVAVGVGPGGGQTQ